MKPFRRDNYPRFHRTMKEIASQQPRDDGFITVIMGYYVKQKPDSRYQASQQLASKVSSNKASTSQKDTQKEVIPLQWTRHANLLQ